MLETPKCSREVCKAVMPNFGRHTSVWMCDTDRCGHVRLQTRDEELTVRLAKKLVKKDAV